MGKGLYWWNGLSMFVKIELFKKEYVYMNVFRKGINFLNKIFKNIIRVYIIC